MPVFTPPTASDLPWVNADTLPLARRLYRRFGPADRGRSVLRIDGVYRTVDSPDQLTLASATEVYLGGHVYTVSNAVAAALIAAGYSPVDDWVLTEAGSTLVTESGDTLVLEVA